MNTANGDRVIDVLNKLNGKTLGHIDQGRVSLSG